MSSELDIVSLRITLRYKNLDEFAQRYAENISSAGLFLRTKAPKSSGTKIHFELLLSDGSRALCGEGVVVLVREGDKPGMAIRFIVLDAESHALVERIVMAHGQGPLAPTPLSTSFGKPSNVTISSRFQSSVAPWSARPTPLAWGSSAPRPSSSNGFLPRKPVRTFGESSAPSPAPSPTNAEEANAEKLAPEKAREPAPLEAQPLPRRRSSISRPWAKGPSVSTSTASLKEKIRPPERAVTSKLVRPPQERSDRPEESPESDTDKGVRPLATAREVAIGLRPLDRHDTVFDLLTPGSEPDPSADPKPAFDEADSTLVHARSRSSTLIDDPGPREAELGSSRSPTIIESSESVHEVIARPPRSGTMIDEPAPSRDNHDPADDAVSEQDALAEAEAKSARRPRTSTVVDEPGTIEEAQREPSDWMPDPPKGVARRAPSRGDTLLDQSSAILDEPTTKVDPAIIDAPSRGGGVATNVDWASEAPESRDVEDVSDQPTQENALAEVGSSLETDTRRGGVRPAGGVRRRSDTIVESIEPTAPTDHDAAEVEADGLDDVDAIDLDDEIDALVESAPEDSAKAEDERREEQARGERERQGALEAEARAREAQRLEDEARAREAQRLEDEAREREAQRLEDEAREREAQRLEDEARAREAQRLEDEAREREARRLEDEAREREARRLEDEARERESEIRTETAPTEASFPAEAPPPANAADGPRRGQPEALPGQSAPRSRSGTRDIPGLSQVTVVPVTSNGPESTRSPESQAPKPRAGSMPTQNGQVDPEAAARARGGFSTTDDIAVSVTGLSPRQSPSPSPSARMHLRAGPPRAIIERDGTHDLPHQTGNLPRTTSDLPSAKNRGTRDLQKTEPTVTAMERDTLFATGDLGPSAIGIDLGGRWVRMTLSRNGAPELVSLYGSPMMPALVAVRSDGGLEAGTEARAIFLDDPSRAIAPRALLRALKGSSLAPDCKLPNVKVTGGKLSVKLGTRAFELEEILVALFLRLAKSMEATGRERLRTWVSIPSDLDPVAKAELSSACMKAGFENVVLCAEHEALIRAYGLENADGDSMLMVDVGASHLGLVVLKRNGTALELSNARWIEDLSASTIDARILEIALETLEAEERKSISRIPGARVRLLETVERARIDIRRKPVLEIELPELLLNTPNIEPKRTITLQRTQVYEATEEPVLRICQRIEEILREAGIAPRALEATVLAGSGALYPPLFHALTALTSKDPLASVPANHVFATGLAMDGRSSGNSRALETKSRAAPGTGPSLSTSIGIALPGGRFKPLVKKGEPLPFRHRRTHATTRENQTSLELELYQGDAELTSEGTRLGDIELLELPKAERGRIQVEMILEIDEDQILTVTLREATSGAQARRVFATQGTPDERRSSLTTAPANVAPEPEPPSKKGGLLSRLLGRS